VKNQRPSGDAGPSMKRCNSSTGQSSLTLTTRLPMAARCCVQRIANGGKEDATALSNGGFALAYVVHELDDGAAFVDRALTLNPNLAVAWHYGGLVRIWLGDPEAARPRFGHAMRRSPFDPIIGAMRTDVAYSHFFAGRYDDAISMAEEALRDTPNFIPAQVVAAVSNTFAGRSETRWALCGLGCAGTYRSVVRRGRGRTRAIRRSSGFPPSRTPLASSLRLRR
jgi:tetratricopeptide (TPR) repeat protein